MGQYWNLFNLDKSEWASRGAANLGEFFAYNDLESSMVNLLLSGQPNHNAWGGDRIILLGDYARALPPNTVTDDDPALLKECAPVSLPESGEHPRAWDELVEYYDETKLSIEPVASHFPEDTVYALRSLNKKEYVRRDIVRGYRKYEEFRIPGLAQALYTLVGWSEDPSASLWYTKKGYVPASGGSTIQLHRGAWAGHRIDVVTLTDEMQKMLYEDGWTDISEETARHISDVYACDHH